MKRGRKIGSGKNYKGVYYIYFKKMKTDAKRRKISFNITIEQIGNLWEKKPFCAYSNISLIQKISGNDIGFTASLDRIDSTKGYQPKNIQWVHKTINKMKSNMSDFEFKNIIKLIIENGNKNLY